MRSVKKTHEADVVIFRKLKSMAPDFHRHMVPGKVMGQAVRAGDRVLVYEVEETVPTGIVTVTERTKLQFR
jgi:hypothetical protein